MFPESRALDADTLDLLVLSDDVHTLFTELGCPLAFWESLTLARMEPEHLRQEQSRVAAIRNRGRRVVLGGLLRDSLRLVRIRHAAAAGRIREFFSSLSLPAERELIELMLGLLVTTPDGRDRVSGWMRRSASGPGVVDEVMAFQTEAEACRLAMDLWRSGELVEVTPSPLIEVATEDTSTASRVDGELLGDLRAASRLREFSEMARPPFEDWELLSMAVTDRHSVVRTADRLDEQRNGAPAPDLNEDLIRFFERLSELRSSTATLARMLRGYIDTLPMGRFSSSTKELALGFVLASPEGRRRARAWLDLPDQYRREAAIRVEGVIGKALDYERALAAA